MNNSQLSLLSLGVGVLGAVTAAIAAYLIQVPMVWQICAGISVVAFIAHLYLGRTFYSELFSKKTARYGLNSVVMSIIALAILIFVNMIATEHDWKKDLTKNKLHTLSEQSVKVIKGLTSEVRMRAVINPAQMADWENVFDKYTYYNNKLLKREYIDVDKDILTVKKYDIKQVGTIVVESDARTAKVDNLTGPDDPKMEEKLTNAIIQVAKGDKKKLYFISGHGEKLLTDTGREGYSEMKETLENGRYQVEELPLLQKESVPADAELVICAGPKSDFMDQELKTLENYLHGGGKLLFMVEPTSSPTLIPFLAKFGIDWKPKKAILETNRVQQLAGGNPLTPIVTKYDGAHEITRDAKQLSIFPIATPIEKSAKAPAGLNVTPILFTSAQSLEVEVVGDKVKVNQATDRKGPLTLGIAVTGKAEPEKKGPEKAEAAKTPDNKDEKKNGEFRLVVVGDSDFASNGVRRFGINADLFQNMLSWLAHEEDLISIRPRPADASEWEITEERVRVINLASIVLAPFGMFIAGIITWAMRRRR